MTRDQIRDAVLQALLSVAPETQASALRPDEDLRDQLEIDSFDFLQFVIALDKSLEVPIPEADYRRLATVDSCVDYLASRLDAAAPAEAGAKPQTDASVSRKGAVR